MKTNAAARRSRYTFSLRLLHAVFGQHHFGHFIAAYLTIDLLLVALEFLAAHYFPTLFPLWLPSKDDLDFTAIASYLISAQVGVLGVISIAIALVTLIAQREHSASDVKLYYHQSLAFEVVASSIALLSVLCAQLLWPFQLFLHHTGLGSDHAFFKAILLSVHATWLLANLAALAYFTATTFNFVQQSERTRLRERYTANFITPADLTKRIRDRLYLHAADGLVTNNDTGPAIFFGNDMDRADQVELRSDFSPAKQLIDVRILWLRWAVRSWWQRCEAAAASNGAPTGVAGLRAERPMLVFTPPLDRPLHGRITWCRRFGGVPLNSCERMVINWSFRFTRAPHAS